jgi:hypothetical protein
MVANPEWKAVRSVHLQGGCRAFNGLNNSVELQAGTIAAKPRLTKMASLISHYLNKNASLAPVDKILRKATVIGGWLYEIGSLRDLAVHVAPLADADIIDLKITK